MAEQDHWFYVLYSLKDHKLYKGSCSDIGNRYLMHCVGGTISTKNRRPLLLIYTKKFQSKNEALGYERYVKTLAGGAELRTLLIQLNILSQNGKLNSDG